MTEFTEISETGNLDLRHQINHLGSLVHHIADLMGAFFGNLHEREKNILSTNLPLAIGLVKTVLAEIRHAGLLDFRHESDVCGSLVHDSFDMARTFVGNL